MSENENFCSKSVCPTFCFVIEKQIAAEKNLRRTGFSSYEKIFSSATITLSKPIDEVSPFAEKAFFI